MKFLDWLFKSDDTPRANPWNKPGDIRTAMILAGVDFSPGGDGYAIGIEKMAHHIMVLRKRLYGDDWIYKQWGDDWPPFVRSDEVPLPRGK